MPKTKKKFKKIVLNAKYNKQKSTTSNIETAKEQSKSNKEFNYDKLTEDLPFTIKIY